MLCRTPISGFLLERKGLLMKVLWMHESKWIVSSLAPELVLS
jgi:hypothetical protein